MESSWVLVYRSLLLLAVSLSSVLSIRIVSVPERFSVERGLETQLLPCMIDGGTVDFFTTTIIWRKTTQGGEENINSGGFIQTPFSDTGRYSLRRIAASPQGESSFNLEIKDIEMTDNGTYTCYLVDDQRTVGHVEYILEVPQAIDSLEFETNVTRDGPRDKPVFEFEELTPSYLSCKARGGNPMPRLKMLRDNVDITDELTTSVSVQYTGQSGLQVADYTVEISTNTFRASSNYSGKNLKCLAKLGEHNNLKQHKVAQMDVKYAPKFEGCQESTYAAPDAQDFVIRCHVSGNPDIVFDDVHWVLGDANETKLTHDENKEGIQANITLNDDRTVEAVLTIARVNETQIREFTLKAGNNVQDSHHNIYFYRGEPTTTTASPTKKPTKMPSYDVDNNSPKSGQVGSENGGGAANLRQSLLVNLALISTMWYLMH